MHKSTIKNWIWSKHKRKSKIEQIDSRGKQQSQQSRLIISVDTAKGIQGKHERINSHTTSKELTKKDIKTNGRSITMSDTLIQIQLQKPNYTKQRRLSPKNEIGDYKKIIRDAALQQQTRGTRAETKSRKWTDLKQYWRKNKKLTATAQQQITRN